MAQSLGRNPRSELDSRERILAGARHLTSEEQEKVDFRKFIDQWFALQVRPRFEHISARILRGKGYEEFVPLCKFPRAGDTTKSVRQLQPLFPGYIFCKLNASAKGSVVTTPGVIRVVGFGSTPASISEQEIGIIQAVIESGCPAYPWPYLQTGQKVRLVGGPLRGTEGIFLRLKNVHRLVVSVSLLQRSAAVEIDTDWAELAQPLHTCGVDPQP